MKREQKHISHYSPWQRYIKKIVWTWTRKNLQV